MPRPRQKEMEVGCVNRSQDGVSSRYPPNDFCVGHVDRLLESHSTCTPGKIFEQKKKLSAPFIPPFSSPGPGTNFGLWIPVGRNCRERFLLLILSALLGSVTVEKCYLRRMDGGRGHFLAFLSRNSRRNNSLKPWIVGRSATQPQIDTNLSYKFADNLLSRSMYRSIPQGRTLACLYIFGWWSL